PLFLGLLLNCWISLFGQENPFTYESPDETRFEGYRSSSQYVELADGTQLATDVFLPGEGEAEGPFPVVFMFTPYNRSLLIPSMGPALRLGAKLSGLGWGPTFELPKIFSGAELLLEHGYVMVIADMRGTGASFGTQMPLMPQLGKDGKEMIDWIAAQPWCNGQVGMMGPSYLGWAQLATASEQPEALKCIMPEVMALEMFTGGNRPGGIAAQRWLTGFGGRLLGFNRNLANRKESYMPAVPVIDEDGDGKLADEWPELDSAFLANPGEPTYKDGVARPNSPYYQATLEHLDNVPIQTLLEPAYQYLDSKGPAPYSHIGYLQTSPGSMLPAIQESGIAIYHVGGWFDGFGRGTPKLYQTLAESNPSWLWMSPRYHYPAIPKGYVKLSAYEGKYGEQLASEQLRFFDHQLKGLTNGFEANPGVRYYLMQSGWKEASQWPPQSVKQQDWWLGEGQSLTSEEQQVGKDAYSVDFTHANNFGKEDWNRWIMYDGPPKQLLDRQEADQACLTYDSPVLTESLNIVGHPLAHIWLSADQDHGDLFVYLSEVKPNGEVVYITEGMLRAGWHELHPDDEQVLGELDIQPDLPWHGYRKEQWKDRPLADGKAVEMILDLLPTAWQFQAGSRIRLSIAGADAGNFEVNSYLCEGEDCPPTTYFIHRGGEKASKLVLPVLGE
ncbi:MAG: CocE/NonD family hydrolase, partial [Bacteroidota bacterium]